MSQSKDSSSFIARRSYNMPHGLANAWRDKGTRTIVPNTTKRDQVDDPPNLESFVIASWSRTGSSRLLDDIPAKRDGDDDKW